MNAFKKQLPIAAWLYFGQTIVGFSLGWTGPVLPKLLDADQTPLENPLTTGEVSVIVSFVYIGIIAGPYISGYLSNTVGRKPCLYLAACVILLSYTMMSFAVHAIMLYVGRAITGVGTGTFFITNLVYIGEMASTNIRGTLLTLTGFFTAFGTLLVFVIGPFVSYFVITLIPALMAIVYLIGIFFFVPETAVYLVMAGKREEAMTNLTSLGRKDDIDEVVAKAKEKPKSNISQLTEIFTIKTNRKAFFIILVLCILQQMSGIIAVTSFVTIIFDLTGSQMESHISTIIIGVTQAFAASIAPVLVDRIGRKTLLLVSSGTCSLSLTALGIYFFLYETDHPAADNLQWLSLVSLMLYFLSYPTGFGIIPNTFMGEMFTDNVRSFGSTFTMTIAWLFGFGVTTAFGYMLPAWGADVTFWIYAGACAFAFFFSVVFVPETKGKSLLEIREMLSR